VEHLKTFFQNCTETTCISGLIIPVLDCVINFGNGSCLAYLGYNNTFSSALGLNIGPDNQFQPDPLDRGQPSCNPVTNPDTCVAPGMNTNNFEQGAHDFVFSVLWDCSPLEWDLDGFVLTIGNTTTCTGACCINQKRRPLYSFAGIARR